MLINFLVCIRLFLELKYNKQIMALAVARWDANMWAAHFVRILAHMPAPVIEKLAAKAEFRE